MGNQYYVYGGTDFSIHEPLVEPKKRQPRTPGPAQCGTRNGYAAHFHKKEPYCDPCRAANSAYTAEYKQRLKARQAAMREAA